MTTSAASGPVKRSKRLYIYWGIAPALLTVLALFCWLVVMPVWEVRSALRPVHGYFMLWDDTDDIFPADAITPRDDAELLSGTPPTSREAAAPIIRQLGGRASTARKLGLFLRLPTWLTGAGRAPPRPPMRSIWDPYAHRAALLLCYCGEPAVPELLSLAEHRDRGVRLWVMYGLAIIKPRGPEVTTALEGALKDEDKKVRQAAAEALKKIRAAQK